MKCVSLNLKEEEILSLIEHLGNQLIAREKAEEVLSNAIKKIYAGLSDFNSGETLEDIQSQKEKLIKRKDALMDLLLDGTIAKSDYSSKMNDITKQIALLKEKEIKIQEKKADNSELFDRLNRVRALFQNKTEKGIEVPLMCSHIEQIRVYEKRMDVYLDFLQNADFLSANYDKNKRKNISDMPICVGGELSGGCENNTGGGS